jgi:cephalosporin-C deacetylase
LTRPRGAEAPLPAVVEFIGYGGGRGLPHEHLRWACGGYLGLIVDTRGQGAAWGSGGGTPDPVGSDPSSPGFMTRGILNPATYYYRRVFTDAVRAVEAVRSLETADPSRVAVVGTSQGGGITLAVGGLVPDLVAIAPNVPFLCNFRRASEISPSDPYQELVRYLSVYRETTETVLRTLNYFDGVNFARRGTAPALFSTALMDEVCPPSTVFAAYNEYPAAKEIEVYPYNRHDGGGPYYALRQHEFINAQMDAHR